MAHAFKTISAKPTFVTTRSTLYQSDYICIKKKNICYKNCNKLKINKNNLIIGQYTKENLENVCTISVIDPTQNPEPCGFNCNPCQNNSIVQINTSTLNVPFYCLYQIDPLGELFGKTQCGELNYTQYMTKLK